MKVFFTLDTLGIGGTEGSTLEIISRFSQNTKVKLIYFYPPHELKEEYERKEEKNKLKYIKYKNCAIDKM